MGRTAYDFSEDEIKEAMKESKTQKEAAEILGCSQGTVSNYIKAYGLSPELIGHTARDERFELPDYSITSIKELLFELQDINAPTVGYQEVDIQIDTNHKILLIPLSDWHIGARYVDYKRLIRDIEFIRDTPFVYTTLQGDYCDNYNTSAYKQGQIEQNIPIQTQKSIAESLIKQISDKTLVIINGCHDEWSYFNDGFDFAQYLAHKAFAYYMGHNGIINLVLGAVNYRIFITHNTYRNSTINDGHGLRSVLKEAEEFDIGIRGHVHKPHVEDCVVRGETRYLVTCGTYKGQDRFASKGGFPRTVGCTPGILLDPEIKEIVCSIDYRRLIEYL